MLNRWAFTGLISQDDGFQEANYLYDLMLQESSIILQKEAVGYKTVHQNIFHFEETRLSLFGTDGPAARPVWQHLHYRDLAAILGCEKMPAEDLRRELARSREDPDAPIPSPLALLHALAPLPVSIFCRPDVFMALGAMQEGSERLQALFGERLALVEPLPLSHVLARFCAGSLLEPAASRLEAVFLLQQGLLVFGKDSQEAYDRLVNLVNDLEENLNHPAPLKAQPDAAPASDARLKLAALRKQLADHIGQPVLLARCSSPQDLAFVRDPEKCALAGRGATSGMQVIATRAFPMQGQDLAAFQATYQQRGSSYKQAETVLGLLPRVILDPDLGILICGETPAQTRVTSAEWSHFERILAWVEANGSYSPFADELAAYTETNTFMTPPTAARLFDGEIALVTGSASGIGKGCVESLLARGAAVIGLDVNPEICNLFQSPAFLGITCDLTDETAVLRAFEQGVAAFGGLDMLVLNAGVFPNSCKIDKLQIEDWQRAMHVNLDCNVVILREAYPLLKCAPRKGRVVVNGSRNVPAPGPGASIYSSSKAALTQLARVAALEWGKDGIRVNTIHPHAVFDTGIWTDEVLRTRAANYGMTVEQYKTNNVLHVELTSHDVGELVAEMLGPLFSKTTGAQVPVDGGSERVI
jgi:NAD(P)-dependent dehydrogenase (short-subunit alcohol dehydrogenase family)/rhamnose utilization protein RhaD (predicted bifunctional aldolase and dehydrogenase)